jgi:hypothetical protein
MSLLSRIRSSCRTRLRDESGIAVPTAIGATALGFALVSAAMVASVNVQRGSTRDADTKRALAAADGGAAVAVLRQNKLSSLTSTASPCLGAGSGGVLVATSVAVDGWCPPVSGTLADGSYTYRVRPVSSPTNEMTIVSTGTAGGVSRRVAVNNRATTVGSILAVEGLIGRDRIELLENADVRVSMGSNGDVHLNNNASACGHIRHGVGQHATFDNNSYQCTGYSVTEGNVTLPVPPVPADIATNNSNSRLATCVSPDNPTGCQLDTYDKRRTATSPWNPTTRVLSTINNATITLGGGDYWLCQLHLSNNSHLIMAQGAQVRIFFDTPENCGLADNALQIEIENNSNITSTGYNPSLGQFDVPGLYLLGSSTQVSRVEWQNNSGTNEFVLYAPNTDIRLSNNATYTGAIAGKTIYLKENSVMKADAGFVPPNIGGSTLFQRTRYVECTGATGTTPDANC